MKQATSQQGKRDRTGAVLLFGAVGVGAVALVARASARRPAAGTDAARQAAAEQLATADQLSEAEQRAAEISQGAAKIRADEQAAREAAAQRQQEAEQARQELARIRAELSQAQDEQGRAALSAAEKERERQAAQAEAAAIAAQAEQDEKERLRRLANEEEERAERETARLRAEKARADEELQRIQEAEARQARGQAQQREAQRARDERQAAARAEEQRRVDARKQEAAAQREAERRVAQQRQQALEAEASRAKEAAARAQGPEREALAREAAAAEARARAARDDANRKAQEELRARQDAGQAGPRKRAAQDLDRYLRSADAHWGATGNPSARVRELQRAMGMGGAADGIFGPQTRARMKSLGVEAPPTSMRKVKARAAARPAKAPTQPSAAQRAAQDLDRYLRSADAHWGATGNPSARVRELQRAMGMGGAADGIFGPQTRARMKSLGVEAPPTSMRKVVSRAVAPRPTARPAQPTEAQRAAQELDRYLRSAEAHWGASGNPSDRVRVLQQAMGMGAASDGIFGNQTRARMKALGVDAPPKSMRKVRPRGAPQPGLRPRPDSEAAELEAARREGQSRAAARLLDAYLRSADAHWGAAGNPSVRVRELQLDMGMGAAADGVFGSQTRARMQSLGVQAPPKSMRKVQPRRAATAPEPGEAQRQAAQEKAQEKRAAQLLDDYLRSGDAHWGAGGNPSTQVRQFQRDMGMGTAADGIFGPQTRARMASLGVEAPPKLMRKVRPL